MVNVLIPTKADDTHALYVKLGLEKKGHKAVLWYTADFPTQQVHTFELKQRNVNWYAKGVDFEINNNEFDVVWFRRPTKPVLSESLHTDDIKNAKNEVDMLFHTFWNVIAPNAFWVNPPNSAKAVTSKVLQLNIAAKLGLKVPSTIISNDPEMIKKFINQSTGSETIYKTLYPMYWFESDGVRLTYTKTINESDLPSNAMLQNTPGIFQHKINKAYELRVTYFGQYPLAIKIRSQDHPKGKMDWRYVPTDELCVEKYTLPPLIDQQCKAFMQYFGLLFGCFDFIVTPDGEYYFLEINESGQFLWIENLNPEIKMLDCFTDFLITKDPNFSWHQTDKSIALSDFEQQATSQLELSIKQHKNSDKFNSTQKKVIS